MLVARHALVVGVCSEWTMPRVGGHPVHGAGADGLDRAEAVAVVERAVEQQVTVARPIWGCGRTSMPVPGPGWPVPDGRKTRRRADIPALGIGQRAASHEKAAQITLACVNHEFDSLGHFRPFQSSNPRQYVMYVHGDVKAGCRLMNRWLATFFAFALTALSALCAPAP